MEFKIKKLFNRNKVKVEGSRMAGYVADQAGHMKVVTVGRQTPDDLIKGIAAVTCMVIEEMSDGSEESKKRATKFICANLTEEITLQASKSIKIETLEVV